MQQLYVLFHLLCVLSNQMELSLQNISFVSLLIALCISWLASVIVRSLINAYRFSVLIRQLPQGPRPLPIVGNALSFKGKFDYILRLLQVDWPRDYGEIYCVYMGPICCVSISSPELLESVLKSQKMLDKGETYKFFSPWLGDGLLLSTGAKWKMRRRLLTPAFHFQILNSFVDVFNNESRILCDILDKRIGNEISELNIYPFVTNCTLDIMCETSMGVSVNAQSRSSDYVTALYRFTQILMERFAKPWLAVDVIFHFSKQGREHRRLLTTLHSFTRNVIKQRRQSLENNPTQFIDDEDIKPKGKRRALLDLLLAVEADETNAGLSDQDIQEEIDTFMFEEKIWTELLDVFGESDRPCSQLDLTSLLYLECCVKEAMRMYSPVPHIERHVKEDFKIGDYLIPSGSDIILLLYGLHHNPRLYPNAWQYDPERFLPDRVEGHHPYSYIPFSAGPRNCIASARLIFLIIFFKLVNEKMKPTLNMMVGWCLLVTIALVHLPNTHASVQYYDGSPNGEIANKMSWMESQIRSAVASGCSIQVRNLITYIETIWWPHIQYLSSRLSPEEQQQVLSNYANLQFMIGMRKCQSDQETFYQGQCYPVGVPGSPCPRNQQLYDRPDNMGYCYCQRGLDNYVYVNGECYLENEQGPCQNDQWLVVNPDRTPSCQQKPRKCPADGQHIYWGCGTNTECQRQTRTNTAMKCSRLGSQQPSCGTGAKLYRSGSNYYCGRPRLTVNDWMEPNIVLPSIGQQTCSSGGSQVPYPPVPVESMPAPFRQCPRGYSRDWNGRCRRAM
ncbi:hypothetical protein GHT06_010940 [Daphnia sinensis]|uniref:DUF4789 domain-containing protein n=1 Tax=Daphnia sinensis TaxID=1820382 RepID=A0AAD5PXW6_9CRUS|nr:hypothetical protein GHT06_010940 [Daphnia sinensis]